MISRVYVSEKWHRFEQAFEKSTLGKANKIILQAFARIISCKKKRKISRATWRKTQEIDEEKAETCTRVDRRSPAVRVKKESSEMERLRGINDLKGISVFLGV